LTGGASQFALFTKYYWHDQIKEYEMGGACSMVVMRNAFRIAARKSEVLSLGRLGCK
jgi:hypothetical protein